MGGVLIFDGCAMNQTETLLDFILLVTNQRHTETILKFTQYFRWNVMFHAVLWLVFT